MMMHDYTEMEKKEIEMEAPMTPEQKRGLILSWFNGERLVEPDSLANFIDNLCDEVRRKTDLLFSWIMIPRDSRPEPNIYLLNAFCLFKFGETWESLRKSVEDGLAGNELGLKAPDGANEFNMICERLPIWRKYYHYLKKYQVSYD